MFNKILVVCIGNICRSPVGEALLKRHFQQQGKNNMVHSAGISAMVGWPASEFSKEVMQPHQIDLNAHVARQLTTEMMKEYDLILVMEKKHQRHLESIYSFARGKIFRLGHWRDMDIADPYQHPKIVFEKMAEDVMLCVQDWIKHL